ncbi:mechanosensitive ion channel family protein [Aestuariibacter halophilus]|uniref:Mechanosensitive ion channel family protein n=1 Tax=Fluctibacter halophilus TaxID=226011 RepID=A0ABS8GB88_9ALTE|nr:mechanosensitive ion channel family protein [Aestuariibacter halophilus]MCC2617860.1 mechanosensitive ion channel family protein [Aestuariibacter halophilus]
MSAVGISTEAHSILYQSTALAIMLVLALVTLLIARWVMQSAVSRVVKRSRNTWDDELEKHRFFRRCAHVVPAVLIYLLAPQLLQAESFLLLLLNKATVIYLILAMVLAGSALFNTVEDVYNTSSMAQRAPITGFIQVGKLLLVIVAGLLIMATLLDKSPLLLLSGLGAVTAILLLLFKDTILGFVAGIQIAANRMVNTGDWIEMPKYGADGTVLQVGLTTVKVQNWDNTISTIPTYALISDPVKNWRGMSESGGRRIKRSVLIDIQSIRFCTEETLSQYKKIRHINRYLQDKLSDLQAFHQQQDIDENDLLNARRLTNIGTFRAYIRAYLQAHPGINQDMTLMVRQLAPTEMGLPLEIYCFSNDKNWVNYEGIQADIFDHLLAMLPLFDLRAYQRVSDRDAAER